MYNLGLIYAYGRGQTQNFRRARSLFEAAARYNHAPSVYYMGLFKYHGYGESFQPDEEAAKYGIDLNQEDASSRPTQSYQKRDYEMALNWFEKAAALADSRISDKAAVIAQEIREFLQQAEQVNQATISKYQAMVEE
jgi:TPR repeat protein